MIYLAQPLYLLLILLIPLMFIAYWLMRRWRKRRIARFGDPDLVSSLAPLVPRRKGWLKLTLLSLALLFFAIGMARPQLGAILKEKQVKGAEIMVVLDVSNSMLAEDYSPNRLERAKLAISKLVDELQGDRIGLIIFAGESFVQLPVTSDYVSAKIFLNSITTESVPVQGTAMGDAIRTAIKSFTSESENSRAIILITDGENHEDDPVSAAKDAVDMGARVFCIGVGSPEGKPIPMDGGLLKDNDGNIVVTRLDEKTLRDVASAGRGLYVRAGNTEFGLNPVIDEIRSLDAKDFQSVVFEEYDEQYMYFFAIALIFMLIEFMISDTRNRRSLFGRGKGMVAVLILMLASPVMLQAQSDRSEVRAGNREFKKGEFREAELDYKRALEEDSTSVTAKYNLGNALYKTESYSEAELYLKGLGDSLKSVSASKASDCFHNSGNLALKQKKYQEAVDAYKESLRLEPDNFETKSNLAYAQKMLKEQQQQQQQQQQQNQQDQQDQQDQNQQQNQDQQDNRDQDNQQDQNRNQDQQDNQNQQNQPQITPQAAQQMLQAIEDKEKQTQDKVKKVKAQQQKSKEKEKNW
jgi:Ca-activated chloride channel family protein